MKREGDKVSLEKGDIIRMNLLVLRQTDCTRFRDWYESLEVGERAVLIGGLCQYAYQAGVDEAVYQIASRDAGLAQDQGFLNIMKNVHSSSGLNIGGLVDWLTTANAKHRDRAFGLFVHLFGEAERKVRRTEDPKECNHWWHRNLEDPAIVESILNDPEYHKTSPRNDEH
jgi:hypothetical protein